MTCEEDERSDDCEVDSPLLAILEEDKRREDGGLEKEPEDLKERGEGGENDWVARGDDGEGCVSLVVDVRRGEGAAEENCPDLRILVACDGEGAAVLDLGEEGEEALPELQRAEARGEFEVRAGEEGRAAVNLLGEGEEGDEDGDGEGGFDAVSVMDW